MYRCVQEAIQNAVKHSQATHLVISINHASDGTIQISVNDNGKGFQFSDHLSGNGLENMKERMKEIDGSFDIQSSNEGTQIVLRFQSL